MEPACKGLSLMTWTGHTDEERKVGLNAKWELMYWHWSWNAPDTAYASIYRNHHHVTTFDTTPQDAARKVCFVVKGKGGKVR